MEFIPPREIGDRVRIMQTTEMEKNGMANKRGVILSKNGPCKWGGELCVIQLDKDEGLFEASTCSLSGA